MPDRNPLIAAMAAALPARDRKAIRAVIALRPQAAASGEYELLVYGDIGDSWFGESVTALDVVKQLQALDAGVAQINVRINSYGGSVSDGIAIYNALKRHPARKVVTVDGVAMSSASLIAMAGDEVQMPETSLLMIHAPWGFTEGNAQELRVAADTLDVYASAMAKVYAAKSGQSAEDMLALLNDGADHYYTGDQAVAAGFADTVIAAQADDESADDGANASASAILARALGAQRFVARAPAAVAPLLIAAAARHPVRMAATPPRATTVHTVINAVDPAAAADVIAQALARRTADIPAPSQPGEPTMSEATHPAPQADPAVDAAAITRNVHAALRQRNDEIKAVLEPYMQRKGIHALYLAALSDPEATADSVRAKALDLVGRDAEPAGGTAVDVSADETDKFRAGVGAALAIRAGLAEPDAANPFRGHSLRELARACVERSGASTRAMDVRTVVATAFTSTSDFPLLLANTAQKALLKGFVEAPESFPLFTRAGTLSDFKEVSRAGLGVFGNLDQIPEGGEYKYGTFGEYGEKVKLATYGKLFAITRQAVINDDLGAFTDVPMKMGRAAKRTIGNLVFSVLIDNAAMADGVALFHANHKNLLTGAAINTASVDAMDAAMGVQTGPDGQPVNIGLRYLIVPRALRGTANVVQKSEFEVGASSRNNTTPNSVRDTFEVIADARLDKASAAVWYGSADPALVDTIEVSYLDGQQQPYMEQKNGWDVDGTEFKVRIDAGVKALDYRGLAKNPGA